MENETLIYRVETETGELSTTDPALARRFNRANPGSSMWLDVVKVAAAAVLTMGAVLATTPPAHADTIQEDQPGWSCVTDGNRICGPNNPEGKPAACYD